MVPIILISCWMWVLIAERLTYFRRMTKNDLSLKDALQMLSSNRPPAASPNSSQGLRSSILNDFLKVRTNNKKLDLDILESCVMHERPSIKKSLTAIAVLAAISPLFGLLGTVTGMMTTFDVIAVFGTGNAKAMAGGISEALITTQSGLLVSIPGLFMAGFLYQRAARLENRLDELLITLKRYL